MKGTPSKSEYETGRTYLHGMENTVLNHDREHQVHLSTRQVGVLTSD